MKKVFLIALALSAGFLRAANSAEPVPDEVKRACPQCFYEYVKYSYEVSLPPGMRKALDNYDPSFKVFKMGDFAEEVRLGPVWAYNKACHSAVFEDFNGDGRYDAALFGRSGKAEEALLLVILSEGKTAYNVIEVERFGGPVIPQTVSIGLSSPGKITEACGGKSFKIDNYGIAVNAGFSVLVLYWDDTDKKFKGVTTGGC
jgi:hypothetical protein